MQQKDNKSEIDRDDFQHLKILKQKESASGRPVFEVKTESKINNLPLQMDN